MTPPVPQTVRTRSPKIIERGALRFRVYVQRRPARMEHGARSTESGPRSLPPAPGSKLYTSHILSYRLNGQRHRVVRAQYADLLREIDAAETAIANGQTDLLDFSSADRARFHYVDRRCTAAGLTLEHAVELGLESHAKNARGKIIRKNAPDLIAEMTGKKGRCSKWQRNVETILERIAGAFTGPLTAYTPADFGKWLDSLKTGERTRFNHFNALRSVLKFARHKNYIPLDFDPLADVTKPEAPAARVIIYHPETLAFLLNFAESYPAGSKLVPFVCITAFAFVRHGEMNEEKADLLDWRHLHFKARQIIVPETVAKKTKRKEGDARAVDMPANLIAWLQPYIRPAGKICSLKCTADALAALRQKAGRAALDQAARVANTAQADRLRAIARELLAPGRNALRKSCISYSKALSSDIEKVADQAGNSPRIIRRNYLHVDAEMKELAERWFAILPQRADVLPLFTYGKV